MNASSPMAYCLAEGGKIMQINIDEKRIAESLEPLQKKYKMYNLMLLISVLGVFLTPIVLFPITIRLDNSTITLVGWAVGMAIVLIVSIPSRKAAKKYLKSYKQLLTRPIIEALYDEAQYYPDMGYTQEQFRRIGLMQWQKNFQYVSEDLIKGTYKGVKFKQSDVKITLKDNKSNVTDDIDGSLIELSLNKRVSNAVLVLSAGVPCPEPKLRRVTMENIEFNRMFDVYAINEHDAFYVLTPHFMEYIQTLGGTYGRMYLKFEAENLYFLRSGGGIAESALMMGKFDIHKEIANTRKELEDLCRIVEILEPNMSATHEKKEALEEVRQEGEELQEQGRKLKKIAFRILFFIVIPVLIISVIIMLMLVVVL